jgi:hypothetical protein
MDYKMNQNAIDMVVDIHKRLKLTKVAIYQLSELADQGTKEMLEERGYHLDWMTRDELYQNEADIRSAIWHDTMSTFDWFRCDIDPDCCNRKDYEPLKVEVMS